MLIARWPSLRAPRMSHPVLPADVQLTYPRLAEDIQVLDDVVGGSFHDTDLAALRHQNRYRRQQVVILLGAAVLTGLGGLQAVFPDQRWPGVLLTALSIALAAVSRTASELDTLDDYFTERVKAERLRALYFRFLSRTKDYGGPDRVAVLRRAVLAVDEGKEPS